MGNDAETDLTKAGDKTVLFIRESVPMRPDEYMSAPWQFYLIWEIE